MPARAAANAALAPAAAVREQSNWRPSVKSEIGRNAGLIGGKRRAEALSAARRKAVAQKAAKVRWDKKGKNG